MKNIKSIIICFFLFGIANIVAAQNKLTETFKVLGNCEMCKKTIETAAFSVKGVKKANWDMDTKIMTVEYNPKKADLAKIHQKIAASGYETDKVKADETAYQNLPDCCHYKKEGK